MQAIVLVDIGLYHPRVTSSKRVQQRKKITQALSVQNTDSSRLPLVQSTVPMQTMLAQSQPKI
ncbi:hypothetical protein BP00DRAFT_182747 [Aspergillus indologenus CBS 114.80]|uniref:Uncharacterized protein n=1 Tax=Aspergillus indologenus CBS 114.80 TaxID=1450541 RepID=A0A2V5I7K9_9EURO|nr:hypothetical protein BP00DRAFT_182747 [Aspergillus indologenus CBS 114.80]